MARKDKIEAYDFKTFLQLRNIERKSILFSKLIVHIRAEGIKTCVKSFPYYWIHFAATYMYFVICEYQVFQRIGCEAKFLVLLPTGN